MLNASLEMQQNDYGLWLQRKLVERRPLVLYFSTHNRAKAMPNEEGTCGAGPKGHGGHRLRTDSCFGDCIDSAGHFDLYHHLDDYILATRDRGTYHRWPVKK